MKHTTTRATTRTLTIAAAAAALLTAAPQRAAAQTVRVDVSTDITRELQSALREMTAGISEAARQVAQDVARDVQRSVRVNVDPDFGRDLGRELGRLGGDIAREVASNLKDLRELKELKNLKLEYRGGGWNEDQDRNWRGQAEDRQTQTLAIGANGSLELHNLSGDITITAGSGRDATLQIIRRSRGRTDADARAGLDRVKANVQVNGTRATVRTDYPSERNSQYSVSVDMVITAPAGTRVNLNAVSSDVKITGVRGELSLNTVSGDMTLRDVGPVASAKTASGDIIVSGAQSDGSMDLGTLSGDVRLDRIKARRVTGGTVSGSVTARDMECESLTLTTMSGDASFSGTLAQGGRYELSSHSGDVHFIPNGSVGYTVAANSFSGDINTAVPLQMNGNSRSRTRSRDVNGKVGDGSASVTLRSFNGDISIGGTSKK